MSTLLADRLVKAGVNTLEARLFTEATECLADARNFEAALVKFEHRVRADRNLLREICRSYLDDRASDMRGGRTGGGHRISAPRGQIVPAASRPNESAGYGAPADKASEAMPAPSTKRNGAGRAGVAEKARISMPGSVSTPPGVSRRGIGAIAAVQPAIAKSIFATTRLPDGRTLDKVQWHELPKLAGEYRQFSRLFLILHRRVTPPDTFMTVDQVVKESDVVEAIAQAERFNDIA